MEPTFSITDGWIIKVVTVVVAVALAVLMILHFADSGVGPEAVQAARSQAAGHTLSPSEAEALSRVQRP